MAETTVHMGENSPEGVAYKLFSLIRAAEDKKPSRKDVLDLYAECLNAVRNPHARVKIG